MKRSILGIGEGNLGLENIERLYQEGLIDSKDYDRWKKGNGVLIFINSGVVYISNAMFEGVGIYMVKNKIDSCYFSVSRYSGIHSTDERIFSTCSDNIGQTKAYSVDFDSTFEYSRVGSFTEIIKSGQTLIDAFKLKEKLSESASEFNTQSSKFTTISLVKINLRS